MPLLLAAVIVFSGGSALAAAPVPAAAPATEKPAAPAVKPTAAAPAAAERASAGPDFTVEAKLLYRVVACAGDAPLPPNIDAKVVEEHCKVLNEKIEKYRKTWVGVAKPFLQSLKPQGLPTTVVYPFGGGDLISALTTYPEAKEITTLSLEHAGDPRRIHRVNSAQLKASLELIRKTANGLLTANDSKTENLMKGQRGELPGQLSFFLIALAVHGYEPVSLRYVKANADGTLRSVMPEDIAALEKNNAKLLRAGWTSPDFSEAFSNAELTFVRVGGNPASEAKVHRHFAENLDNEHFGKDLALQKHLTSKGRVVAMTKAASYLLWRDNFSAIRDYLLANMEFMVSDSTGVPPRFANAAGFEQQAYGKFSASFLGAPEEHNAAFKKLWSQAPPLEFRYGYLDKSLSKHMLITKKAAAKH